MVNIRVFSQVTKCGVLAARRAPQRVLSGIPASGPEKSVQRLWRSGIRLLASWGFGRNGPQRQVRTTVVTYTFSEQMSLTVVDCVATAVELLWNWFSTLSPNNVADLQFWHILGAALLILMVVAGLRLWRMRAASSVTE